MDLFIALIPTIVLIIFVVVTRKVLLSLIVGVILAALIQFSFHPIEALEYLAINIVDIFTSWDWYLPILAFVTLIGGITALMSLTGGVNAFANWAVAKVKTSKSAKMLGWYLGLLLFMDDYLDVLVTGEITKPITDKYKVSRAKLAYIIDSTSAPVVILVPLTTWSAYILGIIGDSFSNIDYQGHTAIGALVSGIPFQFYPIATIIMVFIIIQFNINIGPMKKFEQSASLGKDESIMAEDDSVSNKGLQDNHTSHWNLILPIMVLIIMTLFGMLYTANFDFSEFLSQEITIPLFIGGLSAFGTAFVFALTNKSINIHKILKVSSDGMFSMFKSGGLILVLAWILSSTIQDLQVGEMVSEYILMMNLNSDFLPFILFFVAGGLAFATGTSWGAFGVLLPIVIPIAAQIDASLMPVVIATVLGGTIFGDHSSPVSDTTVLSATGARSTVHAHFISQLPYAFISALFASLGYLLYGFTGKLYLVCVLIAILLIGFVISIKTFQDKDAESEYK